MDFSNYEDVVSHLKNKTRLPFYWIEGDEPYFIDKVSEFAAEHILSPEERDFNLHVLYGKDTDWNEVILKCKQYPAFAETQVIIVKEAQTLEVNKDLLEDYLKNPNVQTVCIIAYKYKKLDGRGKLLKLIKDKYGLFTTKKLYENNLAPFIKKLAKEKSIHIEEEAIQIMINYIGNDLTTINNEINKILINLNPNQNINANLVYQYMGLHREFNIFELQNALLKKEVDKLFLIVDYFKNNPKSGPLILIITTLYNAFSKLLIIDQNSRLSSKDLASKLGIHEFIVKDYIVGYKNFSPSSNLYKVMMILHQYNLKMLGIQTNRVDEANLLKEMICKILIN